MNTDKRTDEGNAIGTLWLEHARQASREERRQAAALPDGLVGVDDQVRMRKVELRAAPGARKKRRESLHPHPRVQDDDEKKISPCGLLLL